MGKWPQCTIMRPQGEHAACAPLVISASRATDVPAFHGAWFMERLRQGYCAWQNPFNAAQRIYVSFKKCRCIVFWTKNPLPFFPYLSEIADRGYTCYFQYTLNNYTPECLEPHLPPLTQRVATFQQLSHLLGAERIIWRYDPIMVGKHLSVITQLERIDALGRVLSPYTEKLVFSYLDMYAKTARSLAKVDASLCSPDSEEMLLLARGIAANAAHWSQPLHLATCAETIDLLALGIHKNCCIDAELMLRLCPDDKTLQQHYAPRRDAGQGALLPLRQQKAKDIGQRKACGCADSKDIGCYNTCSHGCVYCYANQSEHAVQRNLHRCRPDSEALV